MRGRLGGVGVVLALGLAAGGATSVLAGEAEDGPGQGSGPVEELSVRGERVAAPSVAGGLASRAGTPGGGGGTDVQLIYLETSTPLTFNPGAVGATIKKCPRHSTVIGGYYFQEGTFQSFGLADEGGSPSGLKRWAFYLDNETTPPVPISGVTLGMVCLKGA